MANHYDNQKVELAGMGYEKRVSVTVSATKRDDGTLIGIGVGTPLCRYIGVYDRIYGDDDTSGERLVVSRQPRCRIWNGRFYPVEEIRATLSKMGLSQSDIDNVLS